MSIEFILDMVKRFRCLWTLRTLERIPEPCLLLLSVRYFEKRVLQIRMALKSFVCQVTVYALAGKPKALSPGHRRYV